MSYPCYVCSDRGEPVNDICQVCGAVKNKKAVNNINVNLINKIDKIKTFLKKDK